MIKYILLASGLISIGCSRVNTSPYTSSLVNAPEIIKPVVTTETVQFDSDDPAIWINASDSTKSLLVGTDKNEQGALYVFDLEGKIVQDKVVKGLQRPNNVDIEYGLQLNNQPTDIAVVTERMTHKLRIFRMPDMHVLDDGGIEVFKDETGPGYRDLMGISLYKDPGTKKIYAVVGRKSGPVENYLWQYLLEDSGHGTVKATLVRKFGKYSGKKEIESIAVDDALGYIYYSDEGVGIRKYYADPAKGNEQLALFGTTGFTEDHEGISIYAMQNGKGYILVSDQQSNRFHIFPREGTAKNPHDHPVIKIISTATMESDGSDITSASIPGIFKSGLFVAMSTNKTFQLYRWEDIAGKDLIIAPNGINEKRTTLKKIE